MSRDLFYSLLTGWNSGLFDCCKSGVVSCLLPFVCGPCVYGRAMNLALGEFHHAHALHASESLIVFAYCIVDTLSNYRRKLLRVLSFCGVYNMLQSEKNP